MTRRFIILDEKFGRWTVLSYAGQSRWKCRCDCGTVRVVEGKTLRNGTSTGCLQCKRGGLLKHGEKRTRLYTIWSRMKGRPEYDILFRMLEPHELAAAMGFDDEEAKYEFAGTKTQKIKQIGNAVSVSKMKACVSAIMSDAAKPSKLDPIIIQVAAE